MLKFSLNLQNVVTRELVLEPVAVIFQSICVIYTPIMPCLPVLKSVNCYVFTPEGRQREKAELGERRGMPILNRIWFKREYE